MAFDKKALTDEALYRREILRLLDSGGDAGPGTIVLGTFQATVDGTGYLTGDVLLLRQTPPDNPAYVNTRTGLVVSPSGSDLGPVGGASSAVTVTNFPASQTVAGTIEVENFPTTQAVSGTVAVNNHPTSIQVSNLPTTQPVSGTITANAGADLNTSALALESGGNLEAIAANTVAGTAITNATMPAGGAGRIGWLSAIWQQLSSKLPSLIAGRFPVEIIAASPEDFASSENINAVVNRLIPNGPALGEGTATTAQRTTLANDSPGVANLNAIGLPSDDAATSDTGTFALIPLLKRSLARLSNLHAVQCTGNFVGNSSLDAITGTIPAPGPGKYIYLRHVVSSYSEQPQASERLVIADLALNLVVFDVIITMSGPAPMPINCPITPNAAASFQMTATGGANVLKTIRIYYSILEVV